MYREPDAVPPLYLLCSGRAEHTSARGIQPGNPVPAWRHVMLRTALTALRQLLKLYLFFLCGGHLHRGHKAARLRRTHYLAHVAQAVPDIVFIAEAGGFISCPALFMEQVVQLAGTASIGGLNKALSLRSSTTGRITSRLLARRQSSARDQIKK